VATNHVAIDGRGSREPIADNATVAGRAMNRRVEIFVAEAVR
jgi:flagellar motor protein MotB